jgi:hypothetical protein
MARPLPALVAALALALSAAGAGAQELNWSGFASLGYARSDQPYRYERFVNDGGTLRRDSVLGAQLDAQFSARWSATVQATLAPSSQSDTRTVVSVPWAILSYRAGNDILLRAGKLRLPMYINSENLNIGTSFETARLPTEMYSTAPDINFNGVSINKLWDLPLGELSVDAYVGSGRMKLRQYYRTGFPLADIPPGATFGTFPTTSRGVMLTLRHEDDVYRAGIHHLRNGGDPNTRLLIVPLVEPTDGDGSDTQVVSHIFTASADIHLTRDWRLIAEVARRDVDDVYIGYNSVGGYLNLQRRIGAFTPYVTLARLVSDGPDRARYQLLNATRFGLVNRLLADVIAPFDQSSVALGASWLAGPTSKWKAEWMRVHVGDMSGMIDLPATSGGIAQKNINVFSLSYHRTF